MSDHYTQLVNTDVGFLESFCLIGYALDLLDTILADAVLVVASL
jgi:hypothetical protein